MFSTVFVGNTTISFTVVISVFNPMYLISVLIYCKLFQRASRMYTKYHIGAVNIALAKVYVCFKHITLAFWGGEVFPSNSTKMVIQKF